MLFAGMLYGGFRFWDARKPYEWSGTVEARTIEVGSRVGGRVKDVLVREGEGVAAGQPLLALEPGDLEAQRLTAEAQLAEAKAALAKLEHGARPEELAEAKARSQAALAQWEETRTGARREQIAAAEARVQAAQVSVDKARLDRDRFRTLFARGAAAAVDRDNAESAYDAAVAQHESQRQQLDELLHGARKEELAQARARADEARASERMLVAGTRAEDLEAARATVGAAQGRLNQIDVMLGELTIRSPRAARVEALELRPGDIVAPNATAVTLLEENQLYVRIYVPETQLGHVHVGQQVPVSVDSFPGSEFGGSVERINEVGEYSPRNLQTSDERADQVFAVRVNLAQDARVRLRAGMAAFIRVHK